MLNLIKNCSSFSAIVVAIFLSMIAFTGCSGGNGYGRDVDGSAIITSEGGGELDIGDASIYFPPGSVDDQVTLTAEITLEAKIPANIYPLTEVYKINLSDENQYNEDKATLRFLLDVYTKNAQIFRSEDGVNWENLLGDIGGKEISTKIDEFDYFFVGSYGLSSYSQYTINFRNNSNYTGRVFLFQTNENNESDVYSVAWMSKFSHGGTPMQFNWTSDEYSFVWADTGKLVYGTHFDTAQIVYADPVALNMITLQMFLGAFSLYNQTKGPESGKYFIKHGSDIPEERVSSGIALSGCTLFVRQGSSNQIHSYDIEGSRIFVSYGDYESGRILDLNSLNNTAELVFPRNVFTLYVTLNPDLTWTIDTKPFNSPF